MLRPPYTLRILSDDLPVLSDTAATTLLARTALQPVLSFPPLFRCFLVSNCVLFSFCIILSFSPSTLQSCELHYYSSSRWLLELALFSSFSLLFLDQKSQSHTNHGLRSSRWSGSAYYSHSWRPQRQILTADTSSLPSPSPSLAIPGDSRHVPLLFSASPLVG